MDKNIYGFDPNPNVVEQTTARSFPAMMSRVYLWMTLALVITGLAAYYVAGNETLLFSIINSRGLMWGLVIAELALVFVLSGAIARLSFPVAGLFFGAFSLLNGVNLSVILLAYTAESIATTFFVTAGTFGALTLFGLFTKRDLSAVGRFCYMSLIVLIIATLVNVFVASSALSWGLTYIGVLIFCGLTAYDTQKMKDILFQYEATGGEGLSKVALLCSLSLYLDFINLFLYLLRFFGDRRN